jgi:predicted flap endonuclease-1-like 5' DNA nuclease
MFFSYIFLQCTFADNLPTALLLCLLPFLLGWLAAYAFHRVGPLNDQVNSLNTQNAELGGKVNVLTGETTELRVLLSQRESEIEHLHEQMRKLKNDVIICESERNALREQVKGGGNLESFKAAAAPKFVTFDGIKWKWDDLKIVEGIGPKIADLFNSKGIKTWKQLSETSADKLKEILDAEGPNFQIHDPGTWPAQARLADQGKWEELKTLQDELKGGKV